MGGGREGGAGGGEQGVGSGVGNLFLSNSDTVISVDHSFLDHNTDIFF